MKCGYRASGPVISHSQTPKAATQWQEKPEQPNLLCILPDDLEGGSCHSGSRWSRAENRILGVTSFCAVLGRILREHSESLISSLAFIALQSQGGKYGVGQGRVVEDSRFVLRRCLDWWMPGTAESRGLKGCWHTQASLSTLAIKFAPSRKQMGDSSQDKQAIPLGKS